MKTEFGSPLLFGKLQLKILELETYVLLKKDNSDFESEICVFEVKYFIIRQARKE